MSLEQSLRTWEGDMRKTFRLVPLVLMLCAASTACATGYAYGQGPYRDRGTVATTTAPTAKWSDGRTTTASATACAAASAMAAATVDTIRGVTTTGATRTTASVASMAITTSIAATSASASRQATRRDTGRTIADTGAGRTETEIGKLVNW